MKRHWHKFLLAAILLLAAFLTCYGIWNEGYGNDYYTAAVKSMLTSWHNFFFASLDPGGFITVDKPAPGLWLQCLFALIFGVHGWSVILPEALCSVASVALVYRLVGRSFGKGAGLLAALFLALTPIFIAASRSNNLDAALVTVCLMALWALIRAAERGSLPYLLLSMALVGLGFNMKTLEAFLVLPAMYLVYFLAAETTMKKRLIHLTLATLLLFFVSASWIAAVDLTPASERPYVGSSSTDSELELAVGYNGLDRVLTASRDSQTWPGAQSSTVTGVFNSIASSYQGIPNEGGEAGPLRLLNEEMAGQISWLLPLAFFGLLALVIRLYREEAERKQTLRQLLFWGGLFIPMYAYFSVTGHFHRYYMIAFAPSVAALSAIGISKLTRYLFRDKASNTKKLPAVLLAAALIVSSALEIYLLITYYASYSKPFVPAVAACVLLGCGGLLLLRLSKKKTGRLQRVAAAVGIAGLLITPAYWSYTPIQYGTNALIPLASPGDTQLRTMSAAGRAEDGGAQGIQSTIAALSMSAESGLGGALPTLAVTYMMSRYHGERFAMAVQNAALAEPVILEYGVGVMAVGGFRGSDKAISVDAFSALVARGELRFFWISGNANSELTRWVEQHGRQIPASEWSGGAEGTNYRYGVLYDMSALKADRTP